jgi:copper(I)-binding protein
VWRSARLLTDREKPVPQGEYDAVSRYSRRATAVAGVFAVAPLVSACAAGQHPQSAMPTQLAEGVNASVHMVDIRNTFVLGPAPGQQLAAGTSAPLYAWFVNDSGAPDRLVAVEAPGVAQSVQIAGGAVDLPPGRLVNTVQQPGSAPAATPTPAPPAASAKSHAAKSGRTPAAGQSKTPGTTPTPGTSGTPGAAATVTQAAAPADSSKLILQGLTKTYSGGETVRLTLHFQRAGAVTLNIPVVPRNGYYATYSPAPSAPAPSATPTAPTVSPLPGTTPPAAAHSKSAQKSGKAKKASATPSA